MRLMCHCRSIDHFGFSHRNPWKYSTQAKFIPDQVHTIFSLDSIYLPRIAAFAPNERTEPSMKSSHCSSSSKQTNQMPNNFTTILFYCSLFYELGNQQRNQLRLHRCNRRSRRDFRFCGHLWWAPLGSILHIQHEQFSCAIHTSHRRRIVN